MTIHSTAEFQISDPIAALQDKARRAAWAARRYRTFGELSRARAKQAESRKWSEQALAALVALSSPQSRPFRFEDLNGRPEPKEWGPLYPTLPGVEKWRKLDKTRPLDKFETRAYGAAVGKAIRDLQRRELCGRSTEPSIKCNVQNTCGTDNTAAGEEKRYAAWCARLGRKYDPRLSCDNPRQV